MKIIKICNVTIVLFSIILLGCSANLEDPNEYGLWDSETIEDNCNIEKIVEEFFSIGEYNNVPSPFVTIWEKTYGYLAYNPDEYGYFRIRFKNIYNSLINYVIDNKQQAYKTDCNSIFSIELSLRAAKSEDDFVRAGYPDQYVFFLDNNNNLCIKNDYYERKGWRSPYPLVRSCTNISTKESFFDVQFIK